MNAWLLLAREQGDQAAGLTPAGAAIMAFSVLLVLALTAFCFWRILREPAPQEHHHAPLEIGPGAHDD